MLLRRRQQQQSSMDPAPPVLGEWVSGDSHFVPAQPPSEANPPPRPPLAKTTIASILGLSRPTSGAGDAPKRAGSHGGSAATSAAGSPAGRSTTSAAGCAHTHVIAKCAEGSRREDSSYASTPNYTSSMAAAAAGGRGSIGGGGGSLQEFWAQRHEGLSCMYPTKAAAAGLASSRVSVSCVSTAASGLPETPYLRSPEWSPRRLSRSSGAPEVHLAVPPAAASTPTTSASRPPPPPPLGSSPRLTAAVQALPYKYYFSGGGAEDDASGVFDGRDGDSAELNSERDWPAGLTSSGALGAHEDGLRGRSAATKRFTLESPPPLPPASQLPAAAAAAAASATAAVSCCRDLSLVLGVLRAVRCVAAAACKEDTADYRSSSNGQPGADGRDGSMQSAGGGSGSAKANRGSAASCVAHTCGDARDPSARKYSSGGTAVQQLLAALDSQTPEADGLALTPAVIAAPTGVLLLVVAVRLFRASTRWPAAASVCACLAAFVAWWLAMAAAIFAGGRAVGRATHFLVRLPGAIAAWILGLRWLAAAPRRQSEAI